MLYTKKFVFTVSLCAMLAANPVLAVTDPVSAVAGAKSGTPGVVSTVYSDWAGRAESGIAGVTYVNNAVDAAGNAAQWAENHAAAAAQSAKSAAGSASDAAKVLEKAVLRPDDAVKEEKAVGSESLPVYVKADGTVKTITSYEGKAATAGTADKAKADINGDQIDTTYEKVGNKVTTLSVDSTDTQYPSAKLVYDELAEKVDKDQGTDKKNLAMVTDDKGTVYPGYITNDMIADGAVTTEKISSWRQSTGVVLLADGDAGAEWGQIGSAGIAEDAVTSEKIADDAVTFGKIKGYQDSNYEPTTGKLLIGGENSFGWGSIFPAMITSPKGGSVVTGLSGLAIVSDGEGNTYWGQVSKYGIADGAVTSEKIADGAVTVRDISTGERGSILITNSDHKVEWMTSGTAGSIFVVDGSGAPGWMTGVTGAFLTFYDGQLYWNSGESGAVWGRRANGGLGWIAGESGSVLVNSQGQLSWKSGENDSVMVASGGEAVWSKIQPENTEGVVGMVPVGSADATTYSQMWIE